jgi:MoxR-like ATPase
MQEIQQFSLEFKNEVRKHVLLSDTVLDVYLASLLAGWHILLVGPPGVAKTRSARVVSSLLWLDFSRIQFTADLLPSDIVGAEVYNPRTQEFIVRKGPIFHSCILVDELNRAPAKVQSALLESMEEKQVTIAGESYPLPKPFFVIATMNPHDWVGTYVLPEATFDRFLLSVELPYPSIEEEKKILSGVFSEYPSDWLVSVKRLLEMKQKISNDVWVDEKITDYIARLMQQIRKNEDEYLLGWVSLRVSLWLLHVAKVWAACKGRDFVLPEDIHAFIHSVLEHRLHLSYQAISSGITPSSYIDSILAKTPIEV